MTKVATWLASIRGRITVAVTALFALVMVLGTWFLLDRAESAWIEDLRAQDLSELEMIAQDLLAIQAIESMISDGVFLPVGEGGTSYELTDESGAVIGATPQELFSGAVSIGRPIPVGELPDGILEGAFGTVEVIGEVTTVSLPVEFTSGSMILTASSSLEPVRAGLSALRGVLLLVVPLLVAGVGTTTWFVTGRAFRPVEDITSQVERITDDLLDERVPVPSSRDEVAHLARTMNTMLERLSVSRRRQREFVSDASHELRNPVATSKIKLEVALAHSEATDWEETARVVLEEQERLSRLVDDMLLLARIDEGRPPLSEEVDFDDIVFAEADRSDAVNVEVSNVMPARVHGDRRQLTCLVRNLIDNATRHAMERVEVSLAPDGDEVVLVVDDDGPGIPGKDRDRVFERFVRRQDARTRDTGGAGLGLALALAVANAHAGRITITDADIGGARFEIRLPKADEPSRDL